jgi:DNA polymerase III alpha subunit (gram-positive type)
MNNLLRFYTGKYIVFDFETESLNLRYSRPWQVAYIVNDGKTIQEKDYKIYWPDFNISEGAAMVTRFDRRRYNETAVDSKQVLTEFDSYLYDPEYLIIYFNGLNFDSYQHASWRENLGLKPDWSYLSRTIDVHCLYKAYKFGYKVDDNLELWQRKLSFLFKRGVKTSLSAMAKEFGLEVDETKTHDGLYDSHITLGGFNKLKWQLDIKSPI